MFPTLLSKTFAILGFQLFITFLGAIWVLNYIRGLYIRQVPGITAKKNKYGQLDLEVDWNLIKPYFYIILFLDIIVFFALLFFCTDDMSVRILLFTLWSLITGAEIALALISVDENLGTRVLGITVSITFITAMIGMYSGLNFTFMGRFLFFALLALIAGNIIRLFIKMERWQERIMAFFGVLIFISYLLYDFNRLEQSAKAGTNSWPVAMDFAISIYLDIINLFLELLDLLSD